MQNYQGFTNYNIRNVIIQAQKLMILTQFTQNELVKSILSTQDLYLSRFL